MCDILLNYEDNHIAMIKHLITSNEVVDYFWNLYQLINKTIEMVLRKKLNAMETNTEIMWWHIWKHSKVC
jgi:hypothetical protein